MLENLILLSLSIAALALLFRPKIQLSVNWQATVTPLASIIGSGFLVAAPLLSQAVNGWAFFAMLGIVLIAYGIGAVIRYNIRFAEPMLNQNSGSMLQLTIERISSLILGIAYIISVAFYLRLLASFLLRGIDIESDIMANVITTVILLIIAVIGLLRGLNGLEYMEKLAVNIKLAIIFSLLIGLAVFDIQWFQQAGNAITISPIDDWMHALQLLGGILLIVQGFETSRYLGEKYDAETRIYTMRNAQILSGVIYLCFIALLLPLIDNFSGGHDETAIIGISALVATILPAMLIVAAVMSQFSAAVADTAGTGGLVSEVTRNRLKPQQGYLFVAAIAIILIWTASIYEIITIASRAFAAYYFLQCIVALLASRGRGHYRQRVGFMIMASILLFVVIFAIPGDG